jgi:hypothetical protein
VKYATAVRHLREMADVANESLGFRDTTFGWPFEELWVGGNLLQFPHELEVGSVVLVFDLPVKRLPWLREPRDAGWVAERLRLGKRPYFWAYRPAGWPAWNCRDRRVVRFWSAGQGVHDEVIEAFSQRGAGALTVVEPSDESLTSSCAMSWQCRGITSGMCSIITTIPRGGTGIAGTRQMTRCGARLRVYGKLRMPSRA